VNWNDRATCVLFGDGAGAVVLEASGEPGILATDLIANGEKGPILQLDGRIAEGRLQGDGFIAMDGRAVFREAVSSLEKSARACLAKAGMLPDQIDCYVPHQANLRIMTQVALRLGIPADKMAVTVDHHGNTCAASVPLALDELCRAGRIARGDLLLLQGVGAGMTCGSVLLRY